MKKRRLLRGLGVALGVVLLVVLVVPLLVPVPPLEGSVPSEQLADSDSQFVEINGLTVHVKTLGQGEPVFVLLHGFGASLYSWHAIMEPLGRAGTVIAYDRVAFGLTERPMEWDGQNPYSPQARIDLLLGLLDHFDVARAILVGNSAGGTVSMQFTLQHPERVEALILVAPAVYQDGGSAWVGLLGRTPQGQRLGPLLVRSIQSRGLEILDTAWYDPSRVTPEVLAGYTRPLQAENWDRALWYYTIYSQPSGLSGRLDEFHLPVLVISGEADRIVPAESSIRLAGELPEAVLVVIPRAGHVPHEEQPDLFLQAVEAFLAPIRSLPAGGERQGPLGPRKNVFQ
ncbi:MAG: alpha/beta hydrolase [Anaerolineales bacterium]|nr:alpha/beta hydrolase [Anaerolineales bacterium]